MQSMGEQSHKASHKGSPNSHSIFETMNTIKFLKGLVANMLLALIYATFFGASAVEASIMFVTLYAVGVLMYVAAKQSGGRLAFDGLAVEAWIPLVMEDFYPSNSFLTAAYDMSGMVDNDKINFAEAGADPSVLKNNTTYPIEANVAEDQPLAVELDTYDTDSTIVRNAIAIELAYDQRALYAAKHKKALMKKIGMDAAYAYAAAAHAGTNTVLDLGENDSVIDAVIDMQKAYNDFDDDGTNRVLVLNPKHLADIAKEDKVLYKAIMAEPGSVFYGFKVFTYSQNPLYIYATKTKAAQGVAFDGDIHKVSSITFLGDEVMKAQGTVKLFSQLNDPDIKGDKFNFQMRFLAKTLRNKYAGAILK